MSRMPTEVTERVGGVCYPTLSWVADPRAWRGEHGCSTPVVRRRIAAPTILTCVRRARVWSGFRDGNLYAHHVGACWESGEVGEVRDEHVRVWEV